MVTHFRFVLLLAVLGLISAADDQQQQNLAAAIRQRQLPAMKSNRQATQVGMPAMQSITAGPGVAAASMGRLQGPPAMMNHQPDATWPAHKQVIMAQGHDMDEVIHTVTGALHFCSQQGTLREQLVCLHLKFTKIANEHKGEAAFQNLPFVQPRFLANLKKIIEKVPAAGLGDPEPSAEAAVPASGHGQPAVVNIFTSPFPVPDVHDHHHQGSGLTISPETQKTASKTTSTVTSTEASQVNNANKITITEASPEDQIEASATSLNGDVPEESSVVYDDEDVPDLPGAQP